MLLDLLMIGCGIWGVQFFSRALWALLFGGAEVGKFLKDGARTRENRDATYWVMAITLGFIIVLMSFGVVTKVVEYAGVDLLDINALVGAFCLILSLMVSLVAGLITYNNIATGDILGRRSCMSDRNRYPISYWMSTLLIGAAFISAVAAAIASLAFAFGFF